MEINDKTITAKDSLLFVFGKKKIIGKYSFTVSFSKIKVGAGVALGIMNLQNKENKFLYWSSKYYNIGHSGDYLGNGYKEGEKV